MHQQYFLTNRGHYFGTGLKEVLGPNDGDSRATTMYYRWINCAYVTGNINWQGSDD